MNYTVKFFACRQNLVIVGEVSKEDKAEITAFIEKRMPFLPQRTPCLFEAVVSNDRMVIFQIGDYVDEVSKGN